MKKKTLVSAVLAATIMGTTSVSLAAENMFSDVPLDHWAYDAIAKLAEDGIIEGYGDTGFGGDKAITRYEMAQLVAKAQANQENARAVDKAAIEKLQQEFDSELKGEVQNLRKDVDDLKSRMGWYGDARIRFFSNKSMKSVSDIKNATGSHTNQRWTGSSNGSSQFEKRLRLGFWASPAENLSVDGRLKYEDNSWARSDYREGAYTNNANFNDWDNSYRNQNSVRLDKLSLNWNHGNTKISAGRTEVSLGQGLLWWENPVDGAYVQQKFGPKVTATLGVGDISAEGWQDTNVNAQFGEIAVQTSPATKITLANMRTLTNTQHYKNDTDGFVDSAYRLNQYSIGVNTQVAPKWNIIAEAVTNNVGQGGDVDGGTTWQPGAEKINKHGFWTRVTYGKQEWSKANTWQVYGEFFALGNAAVDSKYWGHRLNIAGGNSKWSGGDDRWGDGARGFGLGVSYMLANNTNFEVTYYKLKPYDENAAGFTKYDDVGYAALTYSF
ncbi:S-layer homology domain-containing protein [Anaerovibrio slackiae]|uniref:S-layer homology domain-containing protein n=2 Tax=Anaerovibrio slackiae TaxID=2652309 RepID=UPI0038682CE8